MRGKPMKRVDHGYADLSGSDVYKLRKDLNLTQDKISKKLGLSLRTWCHYEYGTQRMPVSVHMAIQFLQNKEAGEADKAFNDVKEYKEPLTKWDFDRIEALRNKIKRDMTNNGELQSQVSELASKILAQSDKEMGFLLSKIK
jgi:transcriptional regulator with XRE-family HTH domain